MKNFLFVSCIAVLFCSCKKDVGDGSSPVITVVSPSNHQSFSAGQTATISATITDNESIHEVHLYIINKSTGSETLHFEEHTDGRTYNLLKTFTVQSGVTYKIELEANDHADNESDVELEVTGN